MRTFLKRLAIFLTLPAAVLAALSVYWNLNRADGRGDYFAAWLLAFWCVFVWGLYWVISPLTKASARAVPPRNGAIPGQFNDTAGSRHPGWEGLRVLSAGGSLEDAANAIEKTERQEKPLD